MNTAQGPKVIEFNARFGDPEAMNVLSLLESDLTGIVSRIAEGSLSLSKINFEKKATVWGTLSPKVIRTPPTRVTPFQWGMPVQSSCIMQM